MAKMPWKRSSPGATPGLSPGWERCYGTVWSSRGSTGSLRPAQHWWWWWGGHHSGAKFSIQRMQWVEGLSLDWGDNHFPGAWLGGDNCRARAGSQGRL